MNAHVFLLFFNAFLAIAISAVLVNRIIRKEYKPLLKQMEEEEKNSSE